MMSLVSDIATVQNCFRYNYHYAFPMTCKFVAGYQVSIWFCSQCKNIMSIYFNLVSVFFYLSVSVCKYKLGFGASTWSQFKSFCKFDFTLGCFWHNCFACSCGCKDTLHCLWMGKHISYKYLFMKLDFYSWSYLDISLIYADLTIILHISVYYLTTRNIFCIED